MSMVFYETKSCTVCHKTSKVALQKASFIRWRDGEHVQNVWPEMTPDERELLITGTHPKCWDEMFGKAPVDWDEMLLPDTPTDTPTDN